MLSDLVCCFCGGVIVSAFPESIPDVVVVYSCSAMSVGTGLVFADVELVVVVVPILVFSCSKVECVAPPIAGKRGRIQGVFNSWAGLFASRCGRRKTTHHTGRSKAERETPAR